MDWDRAAAGECRCALTLGRRAGQGGNEEVEGVEGLGAVGGYGHLETLCGARRVGSRGEPIPSSALCWVVVEVSTPRQLSTRSGKGLTSS